MIQAPIVLASKINFGPANGKNHGAIKPQNSKYVLKAERYIQRYLLNDHGQYSLEKAKIYLNRTISERDYLLRQLYETVLIQEIELRLEDFEDAQDEAKEELDHDKSKYAKLYNDFLIPLVRQLVSEIEKDQNCSAKCDALVDQYIGAYQAIYTPEKHRSMFYRDIPLLKNAQHLYGYKIKINDSEKIEANNLVVNASVLNDVQACLGETLSINQYLSEEQIVSLKNCRFDFSKLNPGNSFLWNDSPPSIDDLKARENIKIFPSPNKTLKYQKIKFSGRGSPKFDVSFKRGDKKYKVKVKLGKEVHVDPIVSAIGKMLGLHQDETRFRRSIKVKFKNQKEYDQFLAQLTRKFGEFLTDSNIAKVEVQEDGDVMVTFKDVLLEAAQENITKLNSFAQTGWDNLNRRENRAMLLWFAWLGIRDVKDGNWRVQLEETEAGIRPQLSFQDVGAVLDGTGTIDNNPVDFALDGYRQISVNGFPDKVTKRKSDSVQIQWTDVAYAPDFFSTVTYHDMRWMTRQIAKLTREQIEYAFTLGGLPESEKRLYIEKVIKRRNDFIQSFGLAGEIAEIPTMNLDNYQVPGVVENGKVIASRIEGSIHNQLSINPLFYISQFLNYSVNFGNIQNNFDVFFGSRFGAGANINFTDTKEIDLDNKKTQILTYPGVRLELTREVQVQNGGMHFADEVQHYYSIDHFVFEINLNVGIWKELAENLPFSAGLQVKVLKFEFTHWQPTATLKEAITNPIKIHKIIPNLKQYLINDLKAGETFSYSTGNGVSAHANVSLHQYARFGMEIGYANSSPVFYHRNQFGELEIFKDTQMQKDFGMNLDIGYNLGFFFFPLAGFEYQRTIIDGQSTLYRFQSETREISGANDPLFNVKNLVEKEAMNTLLDGDVNDILAIMHREYKVDYVIDSERAKAFFLLFNRTRLNQYTGIRIEDREGKETNLHRYNRLDSYKIGEALPLIGGITLLYGDQNSVDVQLDEEKPEKFVVTINYYDYESHLDRKELFDFIDKQNNRFSQDKRRLPFYTKNHIPREVDSYRKVLAHNRVFLYGDDYIQNVRKYTRRQLEKKIAEYLGMKRLNRFDEHAYERGRISEISRIMIDSANYLEDREFRSFSQAMSKLVMVLNRTQYGLNPFELLFGKENIYVMGEIYGVLESFSSMPQTVADAKRRFTGRSWGDYKRRPPFWKYVDKHPILYSTPEPVLKYIDLEAVYGILPSGESFVL